MLPPLQTVFVPITLFLQLSSEGWASNPNQASVLETIEDTAGRAEQKGFDLCAAVLARNARRDWQMYINPLPLVHGGSALHQRFVVSYPFIITFSPMLGRCV